MKRREFIAVIGAASVWSLAALAQQPKKMVGIIRGGPEPEVLTFYPPQFRTPVLNANVSSQQSSFA